MQRRVFNRVGDQVDADFAAIGQIGNPVDRQAHTVDGDGAFVGQIFCQRCGGQYTQFPTFAHLRKVRNRANTVHMAGHQMPAQTVIGTQGFFEVDGARRIQPGSLAQRLGGDVDGELVLVGLKGGDGHARTIKGDAVAQADVVKIARGRLDRQASAVRGRLAQRLNSGDAAYAGDDSSKHPRIFAGIGCAMTDRMKNR